MSPAQEFRQTCLLIAANNCAVIRTQSGHASTRHSIMLVVYLLAAFALRRNGFGRRDLRPSRTTISPSSAPLVTLRAFRSFMARQVGRCLVQATIKGRPTVAYH
jgi:hypothetical protein